MTEASAYIPPSRAPADIAARLMDYIARHERNAQAHVEGERDAPKLEYGYVKRFLTGIQRLEHQMRCFILFLAAQLIERGLVRPAPLSLYRRGEPDPSGPSAYARRQDREMRLLASGKVRLSPFAITTPVFEASVRRRKRGPRVKPAYKLMPCDIQPVDARYLLARYGRLSRVLLRADVLAERLASRALTVRLNNSPLIPAQAGISESMPRPDPRLRGDERLLSNNPLYYDKLHSILAPEALWESAADLDDERDDLTALHLMAHEGLIAAGYPTGPDPRLLLPEFEKWRERPPDVPQVRSV